MARLQDVIGRGPTASRPASPATGGLYFDTDLNAEVQWDGSAWVAYERALGTTATTAAAGNHTHAGYEPALGTPAADGYHLASTAAGVRSWVAATSGMVNPMTTQDDLIVGGASGAPARLAKGADGQVLTVDPSTHHLVWATPAAGSSTLAADTDVGLATPANGQFLQYQTADSKWHNHTLAAVDVPTLNQDTTGKSATTDALNSATTVVNVAAATAPTSGQVLTATDSTHATWQTPASGGMTNPMTTAGDIIYGGASGSPTRLGKGSSGQSLQVDVSGNLVWANPPSGFADPTTTKGDLIVHGASTTRLAVGSDNQVLTADSAQAAGVKWATVSASDTRLNVATELFESDDFLGGSATSGQIGRLGWSTSGGNTLGIAAVTGHPGVIQRSSGSSSGQTGSMNLAVGTIVSRLDPADLFEVVWIARLNTNDGNTTVLVGLSDATSGVTPGNGIYVEKQDADTQWFGVNRASNTQTRTAALATIDTGWHKFRMRRVDASTIGFSLDGGTEVTLTANIPTTGLTLYHGIKTSAAANKTMDIDYASLRVTGLNR